MRHFFKILISCVLVVLFIGYSGTSFGQKNKLYRLQWTLENAKTQNTKTAAYLKLGNYFLETDFEQADSLGGVLAKLAPQYQGLNQLKLNLLRAKILEKLGNYQKFLELMKSLEDYDDSNLKPKIKAELLAYKGFMYTFSGNRRLAKSAFNIGLIEAKSARDFSQATSILNLLAYEAVKNNEKEKAVQYIDKAIEYAKRSEDKKDLAYCFNMQANLHDYFDETEISVRKNLLAFELVSQEKAYYELGRFAMEIGKMQEVVQNYSGAKYYYEVSLKNASLINDKSQMAYAMSSVANILRLEKKYYASQKLNKEALKLVNPELDQIRLGDIEKNIAQNYTDLKLTSLALDHFDRAIEHFEKGQNKGRTGDIYFLMAEIYFKEDRIDESLELLLKSATISSDFGSRQAKFQTYPLISKIYQIQNKKDLSIRYLNDYIEFIDAERTESANNKVAELGEAFRSEERDRQLAEQAKSLEKQKNIRQLTESKLENATLRSRIQTYFIIAILLIVILASIIGVYRTQKAKIERKRKQVEMSQTLLRSQMNPHFIFNAMSVIQSYIYDNDVEKSSEFLVSFSRLIRLILENSPKEFISIETEIDILNKYLETQKLRFEKRFDYEIICPEDLIFEKALIPPMITQPFVENSIEHGELHLSDAGKIVVRFSKKADMLHVEIEDNGIGRQTAKKNNVGSTHTSMATTITEERIQIINQKENSTGFLSVSDRSNDEKTGTLVVISLPFKKELSSN